MIAKAGLGKTNEKPLEPIHSGSRGVYGGESDSRFGRRTSGTYSSLNGPGAQGAAFSGVGGGGPASARCQTALAPPRKVGRYWIGLEVCRHEGLELFRVMLPLLLWDNPVNPVCVGVLKHVAIAVPSLSCVGKFD